MREHSLDFDYGAKTIQDFVFLYQNNKLNLEPGFQRDSVWTLSDRKKLIDSLLQNYPIPSVFLYRQSENGKLRYDVIDGKQRLETVLMFQGAGHFREFWSCYNALPTPIRERADKAFVLLKTKPSASVFTFPKGRSLLVRSCESQLPGGGSRGSGWNRLVLDWNACRI